TGSGKNGGELGWGPTSNYVPEFAQAVESMKKGDLSAQPVQTQCGWHAIQAEGVRPNAVPTLREAKPPREETTRQQTLADPQKGPMDDATVVDHAGAK